MDSNRYIDESPPLAYRLLTAGVPLSLLVDLLAPTGPDSEAIAHYEGGPRR
jgi:hypothetical protein